jgi:GAF domain-containing protein
MPARDVSERWGAIARRHPRLVGRVGWLRRHRSLVAVLAACGVVAVLLVDLLVPSYIMSGFYLVPITLVALSERPSMVARAAVGCLVLATAVMVVQNNADTAHVLMLLYGVFAGGGLIVLAYLVERTTTFSDFAMVRAQLAEASSDIVGMSRNRADLDELLQYIVERAGEQIGALSGMLLQLDESTWRGRAGYGLGIDARELAVPFAALPAAAQALERDGAVIVDDATRQPGAPAAEVARFGLQRLLVAPMIAFGRDVGVLIFNRSADSGAFGDEQVLFAESVAQYAGAAFENVRLMSELEERRHDLELVRDSSLDIAGSLDLRQVLESAVSRLIDALDMDACDIFVLEPGGLDLRLLVSFDGAGFDGAQKAGAVCPLADRAACLQVVRTREPLVIHDLHDPRLSDSERELLTRRGHRTQLLLPLRTRDRVIGLVELFDDRRAREVPEEEVQLARAICRFAALAIDNAQLFDAERDVAQRLDALTRRLTELQTISLDLNDRVERADPQEIFDRVAAAGARLLGVASGAVIERQGNRLHVIAQHGADYAGLDAARLEAAQAAMIAPPQGAGPLAGRVAEVAGDVLVAPVESGRRGREFALVFVADGPAAFGEEDRLLATTLATQVGTTLRNTLSFKREHDIAETFQNALRIEPWSIPGLDVGAAYDVASEAARVGGDFYDLMRLGPHRLMVAVGDVCGKGLSAAAQTAVVRYMLRAYAIEGSPGESISRLNSALMATDDTQPFVTLLLAYVDVARHMVEFAVAGHPRPIVTASRVAFPVPGEGDLPVGIYANIVYPTNRVVLPEDSTVVLFTDGLIEARSSDVLLGEERLAEMVRDRVDLPASELASGLVAAVKDYAGGRLEDDGLVVVLRLP